VFDELVRAGFIGIRLRQSGVYCGVNAALARPGVRDDVPEGIRDGLSMGGVSILRIEDG
jgi:hypothetical protein